MNLKREKKDKKNNISYIKEITGKKANKKKIIIFGIIVVIVLAIAILFLIYKSNEQFRNFWDENILKKEIEEEKLVSIEIDNPSTSNVFAYSDYIAVLKNNILTKYNSSGKIDTEIKVEITKPEIVSNKDYLAISEKNGNKLYMLNKNDIIWQKNLEGNISRISINANGYVSVVLSGTAYKSVIILYDNTGNEIFKTYLSTTIVVDSDISSDNKYLSFAEVNTSGTVIQSNIKIISIEKAKTSPSDAIIYTYNADKDNLILNIKYQNKDKLICMYNNSIHAIDNNEDELITTIDDGNKKVTFADIELNNFIIKATEESSGLFNTNSTLEIMNTNNKKSNVYNLSETIKEIYTYSDIIGINLGSEVHFVDTNGWLVKKYNSKQSIRGIVMSNHIAGIMYKDKIEIINL